MSRPSHDIRPSRKQGTAERERMLTSLPAELRETILSSLDYFSLISLSRTNHHFYNVTTKTHISNALFALEQRAEREGRPLDSFRESLAEGEWSLLSTHLPCYKCLVALPAQRYFHPSLTTGTYALGGSDVPRRRCGGCYYNARAAWLTESELFSAEETTWIDCVRCRKTKRFVETSWSTLAWARRRCCFDCYWKGYSATGGDVRVVPFTLDGQERVLLEVPIQREELTRMLGIRKMELRENEVLEIRDLF